MTLQSQAMRWTLAEEIGSENSISPADAPANPFNVSSVAVTCTFTGLPAVIASTTASALRWGRRRWS